VLVEAAIILPILLLITLAVTEFGFYFASSSTTTSSSRDGARYATAYYATRADKLGVGDDIRVIVEKDLEALTGQGTPAQMWIYKSAANGLPIGGLECTADCMRYSWDGSRFVFQPGSSAVWTVVDACSTTTSRAIDEVGVMVEVRHDLFTGAIGNGSKTVRERTVQRLEPLPTTQCPA
jgi:Flp pilus assembly protein TadG